MFKALGKLKAAKEKSKKEKSERHNNDDGQTVNKSLKEKEKDRPRSKNALKKKNISASSEEHLSVRNSQAVIEDQFEGQRVQKKRVTKACEEMVNKAVADFFNCAWMACAERFFITTAPLTVSFELRNTWLRIVEVEWLDPALKENTSKMKTNKIFKRDSAPLPLAFDTWSRGALELLPKFRRESVIDPFLRDNFTFTQFLVPARVAARSPPGQLYTSDIETSLAGSPEESATYEETEQTFEESKLVTVVEDRPDSPPQKVPARDKWNFDLDPKVSLNLDTQSDSIVALSFPPSDHKVSADSPQSSEIEIEQNPVFTVVSARAYGLSESTTDRDELSSPLSKRILNNRRKSMVHKTLQRRFSPGQCGGKTGSGVFRLHLETTSEALLRMKSLHTPPEAPLFELHNESGYDEDAEQLVKRGQSSQSIIDDDDDDASIQPLFSERKTTVYTGQDLYQFTKNPWARRSSNKVMQDPTLGRTASEIEKKFLKRRLANLHGHFRRQTGRALAARARQRELIKQAVLLTNRRRSSSTPSSKVSSVVTSNSNNKSRPSHNKTESIFRAGNRRKSISDPQIIRKSASGEKLGQMQQQQPAAGNTAAKKSVNTSTNKNAKNNHLKTLGGNVRATNSHWGQFSSFSGKYDGKITATEQQLQPPYLRIFHIFWVQIMLGCFGYFRGREYLKKASLKKSSKKNNNGHSFKRQTKRNKFLMKRGERADKDEEIGAVENNTDKMRATIDAKYNNNVIWTTLESGEQPVVES